MLSGFFKSERSKYTGVIWHVKIKCLGRGHAHKNASDEVGRQMTRARGPRNTTVDFPALPHLRLCIAACGSKDFDSQSRGAGLGQDALSGSWHCLSILCPATSPRPFPGDTTLQLQGVLYSQHSCFLFLSHPSKPWSGKLDSGTFVGRRPRLSCFIHY